MSQVDSPKSISKRLLDLELQVSSMMKIITSLQSENQELRKLIFTESSSPHPKRPAKRLSSSSNSFKKLKNELITPRSLPSNPCSENDLHDSSRRKIMKDIVRHFHSAVLPNYQEHIEKERNQIPKLRGNDGRIILKNIRYIR
jgi:hypothetical protein